MEKEYRIDDAVLVGTCSMWGKYTVNYYEVLEDTEEPSMTYPDYIPRRENIVSLIRKIRFCNTYGDASNAVSSGGVRIDGKRITDINHEVVIPQEGIVVQLGKKKFTRVR